MPRENKVLSNLDYTIRNYSNYDIALEETRGIIDVPYFPAQNLVDVSGQINLFKNLQLKNNNNIVKYIPYYNPNTKENKLYGLMNRTDARFLFIEFNQEKRDLLYRFTGVNYPQGRNNFGFTYDGLNRLYLFGGFADGRAMNDLWEFNFDTKEWYLVNYSQLEIPVNEMPSRRRKANILLMQNKIYLFGGETDTITEEGDVDFTTGNADNIVWIPLNDIWEFDFITQTWTNYDKNRILPRRIGNIIYADDMVIKILIVGGINEIGVRENTKLYTINKADDTVEEEDYSPPFTISENNTSLYINNSFCIFSNSNLYQFDSASKSFTSIYNNIIAVNNVNQYWTMSYVTKYRGNTSFMGNVNNIYQPHLYNPDKTEVFVCDINLPPYGNALGRVNIDNNGIFWFGGLVTQTQFNERTFRFNTLNNQTYVYDFPEDKRPTERIHHIMTFDKYRNRIWLFGGYDGSKYYNDLWYFDLSTNDWHLEHEHLENQDEENPTYPQPRYKSSCCVVSDDYLYIIGGYSDEYSFSDFWKYHIPTKKWSKEIPIDNIPWGSSYFIFEWNDRLWFFNGDPSGIYRYYYNKKQFVKQPLLRQYVTKEYNDIVNRKEFLTQPIQYSVINGKFFIWNAQIGNVQIDMYSKIVLDLNREFSLNKNIMWLDTFKGIIEENRTNNELSLIYVNISPLFPLTKNQLPHSYFHINGNGNIASFFEENLAENNLTFSDLSGNFQIQRSYIYLDKPTLLVDNKVSFSAFQSEYPSVNLDNVDTIKSLTIDQMARPTTSPLQLWFLYNKHSVLNQYLQGAVLSFKNPYDENRLYLLYDNGNICRINLQDQTFFVYFSKIWSGSAVGYYPDKNVIYAFGGILDGGARAGYYQNGLKKYLEYTDDQQCEMNITNPGFMKMDLNINNLSMMSIENYLTNNNVGIVDYVSTRDYLIDIIQDYLETYEQNAHPDTLQDIKDKIYTSTQPILDDLSQLNIVYEGGNRPTARAYMGYTTINNKLYIFGGCNVIKITDPCFCSGGILSPNYPYNPMFSTGASPFELNIKFDQESLENSTNGNQNISNMQDSDIMNQLQALASGTDISIRVKQADSSLLKSYVFNMETQTWTELSPMPKSLYFPSCINSPDNRYIYIVGGYDEMLCQHVSRDIFRYDTITNTYETLKGIPDKYNGRALPILKWLDNFRLLIMYGHWTYRKTEECEAGQTYIKYIHIPIQDAWIYDTKAHIMYQSWEDYMGMMGLIIKDEFLPENQFPTKRNSYILTPYPQIKPNPETNSMTIETLIYLHEMNLVNGDIITYKIFPDSEIYWDFMDDYSPKNMEATITPPPEEMNIDFNSFSDARSLFTGETEIQDMTFSNIYLGTIIQNNRFRFRYAWFEKNEQTEEKVLYVIGERAEKSGINFVQQMAEGYTEAHLRFWWCRVDLPEQNRIMNQIVYEYPLPISPICVTYDGKQYLYVIYNKYNIWRLDFKAVRENPNGSYWLRLPPCINCNFLGDTRTDPKWEAYCIPPKYLVLVSKEGLVARMDTQSFTWYLDKKTGPIQPIQPKGVDILTNTISNIDEYDIYKIYIGGVGGQYMNLYYKQWDNFFYDLRDLSGIVKYLKDIVNERLYPTIIKRKRLYAQNHLGHLNYAWIRVDGYFDVDYQLNDFYDGQYIRIYADLEALRQSTNFNVSVFSLLKGWVDIDVTNDMVKITDRTWDWDGQYTRRYVRQFEENDEIKTSYTMIPPNYIEIDLKQYIEDQPLSHVRVSFLPEKKEENYITRINNVDIIDTTDEIQILDSPQSDTPLEIVHIEPVQSDVEYSVAFAVYVKNIKDTNISSVIGYMINNKWLQFSNDNEHWFRHTPQNPFKVADVIKPNDVVKFYIRGMNIDEQPHIGDLVVKGYYPYGQETTTVTPQSIIKDLRTRYPQPISRRIGMLFKRYQHLLQGLKDSAKGKANPIKVIRQFEREKWHNRMQLLDEKIEKFKKHRKNKYENKKDFLNDLFENIKDVGEDVLENINQARLSQILKKHFKDDESILKILKENITNPIDDRKERRKDRRQNRKERILDRINDTVQLFLKEPEEEHEIIKKLKPETAQEKVRIKSLTKEDKKIEHDDKPKKKEDKSAMDIILEKLEDKKEHKKNGKNGNGKSQIKNNEEQKSQPENIIKPKNKNDQSLLDKILEKLNEHDNKDHTPKLKEIEKTDKSLLDRILEKLNDEKIQTEHHNANDNKSLLDRILEKLQNDE